MNRLRLLCVTAAAFGLASCGKSTNTEGGPGSVCGFNQSTPTPLTEGLQTSGHITYEHVPHTGTGALDFAASETRPVRGVSVQFLNGQCELVAEGNTDEDGAYTLTLPANTEVRLRAVAELKHSGTASWQVRVTDNTRNNAIYALEGSLINTGDTANTRTLHAVSGWQSGRYRSGRHAAPFAILDAVYEAISLLRDAEPAIQLPALEIRWSSRNLPVQGSLSEGEIGTSFYDGNNIYLLGDGEGDSDEFDRSVVQHEFAHFLEDRIFRSDSLGGPHGSNTLLDMRVAFSEGLGNAFSGMASASAYYYDSNFGFNGSFYIHLEDPASNIAGWYSEASIGRILYDIYDSADDGPDSLSLGFGPVYQALSSADYRQGNALASIYTFAAALKNVTDTAAHGDIDDLLTDQAIFGEDAYGSNESNDGGSDVTLPIYRELSVGDSVEVCSDNYREHSYNPVDARRFIRFSVSSPGRHYFHMEKTQGSGVRDPDMHVLQRGAPIASFDSGANADSEESGSTVLDSGDYVLEAYDFYNIDIGALSHLRPAHRTCFNVSISL